MGLDNPQNGLVAYSAEGMTDLCLCRDKVWIPDDSCPPDVGTRHHVKTSGSLAHAHPSTESSIVLTALFLFVHITLCRNKRKKEKQSRNKN